MEKRVTYDNAIPPSCQYPADRGHTARGRERGQGNFELAANSDYDSRGSADPRESLRRRRISKLALNAHKVLRPTDLPPRLLFLLYLLFSSQIYQL